MSTPFFSVVIPAYNQSVFFKQALQSIVDQTFSDWEVVVIDDGSRAEEAEKIARVVDETCRQVPAGKIRFFRQENQGVSVTRNWGVTQTSAAWLGFLDNDDVWRPTMMEEIHRVLEAHPQTDLCHTNFDYIDENDQFITHGFGRAISYLDFLSGNFPILPCCSVVSRNAFIQAGGFDAIYPLAQDLDFYLKIYARDLPAQFIDLPLALYRSHTQNVTRNYRGSYREIAHILQKHFIFAVNSQHYEAARAARRGLMRIKQTYGEQGTVASIRCFQDKKFFTAAAHGVYAMHLHPRSFCNGVTNGLKRKWTK